ncbi:hypothetical protein [Cumulibacter manganitolerans]|uniref:hypothetical protein n=1 Tax=Cumulibacter manganitolerans TaxID=1884992 RepID=UPI001295F0B2|nr:hypothetical protein [Cumulibacter manganitolerans]
MVLEHIQQRLKSEDRYDCPWSWDSLTPELTAAQSRALVAWVLDYNENFVVRSSHLIPQCWPIHRGLAREIAATYSHWMAVFHHPTATPSDATYFYDRVLPPFQDRISRWLGPHAEKCQAGTHDAGWDKDVAERVNRVHDSAGDTLRALDGGIAQSLATTRSAPAEGSDDTADDAAVGSSHGRLGSPDDP